MELLNTPTTSHVALPSGEIRNQSSDFVVDEHLGFEPEGDGEHLWLRIRKTDLNTRDLAAELAALLGTQERLVNYSGLKDRIAVTSQWFSVPWPIREALPALEGADNWQLLSMTRGRKRLRSGAHRANQFQITIRRLDGDRDLFDQRVAQVRERGFPNYYGVQRFGHDGGNLHQARRLFSGRLKASRFKKGLYLSAARSCLFNRVLAERVERGNWDRVIDGDMLMLNGSNSRFPADDSLELLQARCEALDIHPSGPLAGRGEVPVEGEALQIERHAISACEDLQSGLVSAGLKHERRALRALATDLAIEWLEDDVVQLRFALQRGVYATSLLQELIQVRRPETR
jgi:tRNA pseudouridine13 synthase